MLVVDASVAIKWFVVEPGQSEARRLFASTSSTWKLVVVSEDWPSITPLLASTRP
jgi:predicted nucleic acid-binding protein